MTGNWPRIAAREGKKDGVGTFSALLYQNGGKRTGPLRRYAPDEEAVAFTDGYYDVDGH
jgi:hypothetical protein